MDNQLSVPYTICFCIQDDKILMLYRNRKPNQYKWNGLGGKIEANETPLDCIQREVMEEAELDLNCSLYTKYGGVVTWNTMRELENSYKGMHVFIAEFPTGCVRWVRKEVGEGILEWKDINWVCDENNGDVVDNIPFFVSSMIWTATPYLYECLYVNGVLETITTKPLFQR